MPWEGIGIGSLKMKLIDRYIFKEFITPFTYCFFAFLIIFIVGDLFENLDDFIIHKVPWMLIGKYYLFLIPTVFILTTPLAVLLSILYQLGYMSKYNELNALKSSGVSFWRIIIPFGIIGIIFSILLFIVNERQIPKTSKELDSIRETFIKKKVKSDADKHEKIAYFSSLYNLSFYIDKMSGNDAEGISVREFYKDGSLRREWYGEKAVWLDNRWWLFNGYIRKYSVPNNTNSEMNFFKKCEVPTNIPPEDLLSSQAEIAVISNYMNIKDLYTYIRRNFTQSTLPKELVVELYRKIAIPITIIVVTMFGITFGGRISRGGALASVGTSLAFYLAYYGVNSLLVAMGKLGRIIPVLAVWTPHLLFGIISVYLLRKTR